MKILVVGASGATGRLLVQELLNRGEKVLAIVRSPESLSGFSDHGDRLMVIKAGVYELDDRLLAEYVGECDAIASCLGHNITLKGIFGHPRRLVSDVTRRLCAAVESRSTGKRVRFTLMNTTGNVNRDLNEVVSFAHKCALGLIRLLIPPQRDNELAAEHLRSKIGQNNPSIEWVVVRPDSLTDEESVSNYEVFPSPIRDAIFDSGQTSRSNVAHFMASLLTENDIWNQWRGRMPVIYNAPESRPASGKGDRR